MLVPGTQDLAELAKRELLNVLTQSVPVEKCLLPGSQDLAELAKKTTKC